MFHEGCRACLGLTYEIKYDQVMMSVTFNIFSETFCHTHVAHELNVVYLKVRKIRDMHVYSLGCCKITCAYRKTSCLLA